MIMPVIITRSAHCQDDAVRGPVFRSARRNSHSCGKSAATVKSPRGGVRALRPANLLVSTSDQNDCGNSGSISRTRMLVSIEVDQG